MLGPTSAIIKPVGNQSQLPKSWRRIVSDQQAGRRTRQAPRRNTHATGSSDTLARLNDPDDFKLWPISVCTSNLYKIGKGQNPSGILATCRSPKLIKAQSGGNDQIQRLCALQGMNSKCASVSYVASTHQVFPQLITKAPIPNRGSTPAVAGDPPEPSTSNTTLPPNNEATTTDTAPAPATTTHHRARAPDDRSSHPGTSDPHRREYHRESFSAWNRNAHDRRGHSSTYREGRSRDHHREGSSRYYSSNRDADRSSW